MSKEVTQSLTLMFVDIASLQTIRANEGEGDARSFLKRCVSLINEVRKENEGQLIRTVGGTVLCSFVEVDNALRAAVAMHERVANTDFKVKTKAFLRMGLHMGVVELRDGSCSGDVVTTTARMVTLAQPGQTIATGVVKDHALPDLVEDFVSMPNAESMEKRLGVSLYQVGQSQLEQSSGPVGTTLSATSGKTGPKAKASEENRDWQERTTQLDRSDVEEAVSRNKRSERRPIVLQEVDKKSVDTQADAHGGESAGNPDNIQLCLIWHDHVISVCSERPVVTLGREAGNDVILTVRTASRRHADIQMREGKFFLVDHSGNGTFIYDEQGNEHYVEQGEVELSASGALCPGCPQQEAGCEALLFWIAGR